ncbi:Uncharacterised protein [Mycobacteroides abscessus subsp. abscessus]|uniref:Uncharacterized protein n=1 Tax=Mycobacteroides abscessus subsp. bolletii CRM-0020 TaxID=1306401 RepID=A0A829HUS8_9MYCO|nr:hypothetical protein MYCMA_09045 [Mycobacteroides abscessus subsp. massiliense str. GO 06]AMU21338.1 hypothetical protein A3N95_11385 [Mycobacteroides abscessus]EHC01320.1 hypothetical protein MAB47J26_07405 [Mycobacteroides abscessus 47J26]EPQ23484.1 hypothetical protein J108_11000 [Mycobacteroides abscessus subsp. bolletii CRM-0020]TPF66866.1 hypothetical protein XW60_18270 [Mycobacteroides abscessus subsp. bolletii]SHV38054.1 Uncharacterised protein [Mycobacteroides abscessus subsp. absc
MPTGSHHQPFSQFNGVDDTGGRQVLAAGSHHPPGQLGTIGSAEPITGERPDIAAIGNSAPAPAIINRRASTFI